MRPISTRVPDATADWIEAERIRRGLDSISATVAAVIEDARGGEPPKPLDAMPCPACNASGWETRWADGVQCRTICRRCGGSGETTA